MGNFKKTWDSDTVGEANPANWLNGPFVGTSFFPVVNVGPFDGSHCISWSNGTAVDYFRNTTPDGFSGNGTVKARFHITGLFPTGSQIQVVSRIPTTGSFNIGNMDGIKFRVNAGQVNSVMLVEKRNNVSTVLVQMGTTGTFALAKSYEISVTPMGTLAQNQIVIDLQAYNITDNLYLTSSNVWQAGQANCATTTVTGSSHLYGEGYQGMVVTANGTGFTFYFDDLELVGQKTVSMNPTTLPAGATVKILAKASGFTWTPGVVGSPNWTPGGTGITSVIGQRNLTSTDAELEVVTDPAGGSPTLTYTPESLATPVATVSTSRKYIPIDNVKVLDSGMNWDRNGHLITNFAGAELVTAIASTGGGTLEWWILPSPQLASGAVVQGNMPIWRTILDYHTPTDTQVSLLTPIVAGGTLLAGTNPVYGVLNDFEQAPDIHNPGAIVSECPPQCAYIMGLVVPSDASLVDIPADHRFEPYPEDHVIFGDSTGRGASAIIGGDDAMFTALRALSHAMGCNHICFAQGSWGMLQGAIGNRPAALLSWDLLWAGKGIAENRAPKYVTLMFGTADYTGGGTDTATWISRTKSLITAILTRWPNVAIWVSAPEGQQFAAAAVTAVTEYQFEHPGAKVFSENFGPKYKRGGEDISQGVGYWFTDGIHHAYPTALERGARQAFRRGYDIATMEAPAGGGSGKPVAILPRGSRVL